MTAAPVLRFAPSPNGAAAPRPCAVGADRLRHGAPSRRPLPGAHRGHRRRPLPRGVRRRHLRGSRLARHRLGGAGAAPVAALCRLRAARRSGSRRKGCSTRALPRAARSRRRRRPAPSIPTARRSTRACTRGCRGPRSRRACSAGERFALRLDMERRAGRGARAARRSAADLHRARRGRPAAGRGGAARAVGRCGHPAQGRAGELSPRRRRRRCAPGRHPRHARPRPLSRRPTSTACCRCCSACPSRSTIITGC